MSRMKGLKIVATAALLELLFANIVSIGLVKAAHDRPHRAAITSPRTDDGFSAVHSDRLALLIANSDYPDADALMANVSAGANTLANVLRNRGFSVVVVRNTTRAEMTAAIDRLKAAARPGSVVLVYFGGFAVQSEGQNYMIPVDAKIWRERDVRRDGVEIETELSGLRDSGARARIAIIDASRRNPYERRFRSYSHGLAPTDTPSNTIVITSTSPDQVEGDADVSANRFVNGLATEIGPSSRPIDEVLAARAAAASPNRRERERSPPATELNRSS